MTPKTAAPTPTPIPGAQLLTELAAYYNNYATFADPRAADVFALWTCATFAWPHFDAFPYLTITSPTKRSGKTRTAELLGFTCSNPMNFAGMTAATVFRSIRDKQPTMFVDEAETLSSETAGVMRAVLNVGYRRGQTIPRVEKGQVVEYPAYCPKVFVLIGDVYDTLRDRSIVVTMQRAEPRLRFVYDHAKAEGQALRERASSLVADLLPEILARYTEHRGLDFLQDRDEEIWLPIFALCQALDPSRVDALTAVAVDFSTDKTAAPKRYVNLLGAEQAAEDDEYARRLLRDLHVVLNGERAIWSQAALDKLRATPTMPWRRFRGGEGLTLHNLADLLDRFGLHPKWVRSAGGRKKSKVARGYSREDVERALKTL